MLQELRDNYLLKIPEWLGSNYITLPGRAYESIMQPARFELFPMIRVIHDHGILRWGIADVVFMGNTVRVLVPESYWSDLRPAWGGNLLGILQLADPQFQGKFQEVLERVVDQDKNTIERLQ